MRFLLRFFLGLLLAASLGLLGLYARTPYAALAARVATDLPAELLDQAVAPALTPGRYAALRRGLAGVAGAAALGLVLTRRPGRRRRSGRSLVGDLWAGLGREWTRRSRGERLVVAGLLLAATAVRLWYAVAYPLTLDELASFDFWVVPGPAVTASYYAYPNNHILPNLLVGAVHAVAPGAGGQLALRLLPTLLGLGLLPLGYALLLRYVRFEVATLGWGLFSLSPLPVFYAVAGRGYGWALAALLAGLWASLELLRPQGLTRARRQRAWAVFGVWAVLGLYAVPTHLYGLLGLGLGLLVGFRRWPGPRRWPALRQLTVAVLGIGLTVGVLYAPVVAVSGWEALVANPFVLRLSGPQFWAQLGPYYLLGTASELLGQGAISAACFGLVALATPAGLRWGRLPEPTRRLGWLAYAQLVLWLPLLLVQHVFAPARTLLAVLLVLLVLAALLGQVVGARAAAGSRWRPAAPARLLGLALLLGSYGLYRLGRDYQVWAQLAQHERQLHRAYAWLQARRPGAVWLTDNAHGAFLFWHYYALEAGQVPLPVHERRAAAPPRLGRATGPAYEVLPAAPPGRMPAYADADLVLLPLD